MANLEKITNETALAAIARAKGNSSSDSPEKSVLIENKAERGSGDVVFQNETAGFTNAIGAYKIAADGSIYDVTILFANASLQGSGGNLVAGKSATSFDVASGDKVGFFLVPNGYSQAGMASLLDGGKGKFAFVDGRGNAGNVNSGVPLTLVHTDENGKSTTIKSQYGTAVFHSVDDGSLGLNGDGFNHARVTTENGVTKVAFEDLWGGGDQDFDDSVFTFRSSVSGVTVKVGPVVAEDPVKLALFLKDVEGFANDQVIMGTRDADKLIGGSGNDLIKGGAGDDYIVGNGNAKATVPLHIRLDLGGNIDPDSLVVYIGNVPDYAELSAGARGSDGVWKLAVSDLAGLTITTTDNRSLDLKVVVESTDGSGLYAGEVLSISFQEVGSNTLVGGAGNDVMYAGDGGDLMYGGNIPSGKPRDPDAPKREATVADNDTMYGGVGNDTMYGGAGDDVMHGEGGDDLMFGGSGNDLMFGGAGNDTLNGGEGDDVIHTGTGDNLVSGGKGDDVIYSGSGNNVIYGNTGDDVIVMGGGNDKVFGGQGFDTIDFSKAERGVTVNLREKAYSGWGEGHLDSIEAVVGSAHDDLIVANGKDNVFTGNGGNDTFVWHWGTAKTGNDVITDFDKGDVLDLSRVLKGRTENLAVKHDDKDTYVFAMMDKQWFEVVKLEGFHASADDMLTSGMILAG